MKNFLKSLGLFSLFFNTHPQMNGITECDIPYEDCSNGSYVRRLLKSLTVEMMVWMTILHTDYHSL